VLTFPKACNEIWSSWRKQLRKMQNPQRRAGACCVWRYYTMLKAISYFIEQQFQYITNYTHL